MMHLGGVGDSNQASVREESPLVSREHLPLRPSMGRFCCGGTRQGGKA